jgi:hypothetical protein
MKNLLSFCLFFGICAWSHAQFGHDVVYLKNGIVINGKVSKTNDGPIKIHTLDGYTFVIQQDEILKQVDKTYHYAIFTSAGMIIGSSRNQKPIVLSVVSEHNYLLNKYFGIGALTGVELINETTVPLGGNVKIFLPFPTRTAYLNGSLSKSFSVDDPVNFMGFSEIKSFGGPFATLELGVTIPLNYRNAFFMAAGFRYNELNYEYTQWNDVKVDRVYYYKRISLRFGIHLY